ncbi:MAG: YsnF/AvaK domain-containing protein [Telluria sp.]
MQHTLVAVFDNRTDAQSAMDELLASGFSRQEVRLSEGTTAGTTDTMGSTGTSTGSTASSDDSSITGSIKHFFSDLFGSDDTPVNKYSEAVTRGSHVLTVVTASEPEVERAADLIERFGPVDIDEKASQWGGATSTGQTQYAGAGAQQSALLSAQNAQGTQQGSQQRATGESAAIPIIQEELQVGKREVQRGGVRVFQRMVETPVSETVNLREEHVHVERHAVDQPASSADLAAFQEKSIELRETAEEAVVQKSARIVEEVVIGKEVTSREEQISDTVRHTEVDVQQLGAQDDDAYYRNHFNSNYATSGGRYEDYAPAYGYGSTMASSQYRGRSWDEVEPNLRSDWETRNPGSTWEKIKAAVRHGWDRVTS